MIRSRHRCDNENCSGWLYYDPQVLLASNPAQRHLCCDRCGQKLFMKESEV